MLVNFLKSMYTISLLHHSPFATIRFDEFVLFEHGTIKTSHTASW
jgi:hypothetical protein